MADIQYDNVIVCCAKDSLLKRLVWVMPTADHKRRERLAWALAQTAYDVIQSFKAPNDDAKRSAGEKLSP